MRSTTTCLVLAMASLMRPEGSEVKALCNEGFYQEDPVVLGCKGGKGRQSMILSSRTESQGQFSWEVPKGTMDISTEVLCEPLKALHGSAKLSAKCAGPHGEVLLSQKDSLLNQSVKTVDAHGAKWSWSGDPDRKNSGSFSLWLRVQGQLHCDVRFVLENDHESNLAADLRYSWSSIEPCPKKLKGCAPCPADKCIADDIAVCNGSPYWECLPDLPALGNSSQPTASSRSPTSITATSTTLTITTSLPPSFEDLMADPKFSSMVREEEGTSMQMPFQMPEPTSHPAVTLLDGQSLRQQPPGQFHVMNQDRTMSFTSTIVAAAFAVCLSCGALCMCCMCVPASDLRPSEEVRGQLGAAIQGQRTMYQPVDEADDQV
ncbi:unnamed protein product [Effrenium voratum]|nr:unnamed protein product [Effrenium voratum]